MAAWAAIIQAALKAAEGGIKNAADNAARGGLRRQERQMSEDNRSTTELLRHRGDQFLAEKKVAYLKNGVSLEGSPLLAMEADEAAIKAEIDAANRRFEAEIGESRKARKRLRRRGRMSLLGLSAAAYGGYLQNTKGEKPSGNGGGAQK